MNLRKIPECFHLGKKSAEITVCLVYPGESKIGFSSLAIHRIYTLLNELDGVLCDLYFEDFERSLFLHKNPGEFDVIAFSVTYEKHLLSIASILHRIGIPPFREKRNSGYPLVIGGGIGVSYNPAPYFPIFDAIYLGEAEDPLRHVFEILKKEKNTAFLRDLENVVVPEDYTFEYHKETIASLKGKEKKFHKALSFPDVPSHSCFLPEDAVFKEMFLIEVSRGCPEMCRFCISSFLGLPYREKRIEILEREIEIASRHGKKVGLIGSAVTDYTEMKRLARILKESGIDASFSSIKVPVKSESFFDIIENSSQKTITIAPESGNQNLRFAVNKKVPDEEYFEFTRKALECGIENVKLYFLVGLPGEREEDLESIVGMVKKIKSIAEPFWRKRGKTGRISVSVNPVVSKPFTPLQWYGLNPASVVGKKLKFLEQSLKKIPNVVFSSEGKRNYVLQAVISRGDPRVGVAIIESAVKKVPLRKALKEKGLNIETLYTRERGESETFPWDFINCGISRKFLFREYLLAKEGKTESMQLCKRGGSNSGTV